MELDAKRPLFFRVRLTRHALAVADSFISSEYVTHNCGAIAALTDVLPGIRAYRGPIARTNCRASLQRDRSDGTHLVRDSRRLMRHCRANDVFGRSSLTVSQCVQYTTEGKAFTDFASGKRFRECEGSHVDVFVSPTGNRWLVIAENDAFDWSSSPCSTADASRWRHREPWQSP